LRDFLRRSIFDFYNKIGQKLTSPDPSDDFSFTFKSGHSKSNITRILSRSYGNAS
jgi:hypothetical protein